MVRKVIIFVILSISLSGCGDYSKKLPNGYSLVSQYSGSVGLSGPGGGVIEAYPTIDGYQVIGEIVVGHVDTQNGYFILDTRKRILNDKLSKKDWLDMLKSYGINEEPRLKKP